MPEFSIFGGGDVVERYIFPALLRTGVDAREIEILSPEVNAALRSSAEKSGSRIRLMEASELAFQKAESNQWIVATPSNLHLPYVSALSEYGALAIVEKPLFSLPFPSKSDLEMLDLGLSRAFLLSYYILEKALPLTFVMDPRPQYKKFLEIDDPDHLVEAIHDSKSELGQLLRFDFCLLEGAHYSPSGVGNRIWTETNSNGGYVFETLIHPLSLMELSVGNIPLLLVDTAMKAVYEPRRQLIQSALGLEIDESFIAFQGRIGNTELSVVSGKHMPDDVCRRLLELSFENGVIRIDFEQRKLVVKVGKRTATVTVRPELLSYDVQIQLALEFLRSGHGELRFDDYPRQIRCLCAAKKFMSLGERVSYDDRSVYQLPGVDPTQAANLTFDLGS